MSSGVKDLKVWTEAVALAGEVVRAARQATRRETKGFMDAMMESAVAVPSRIAEGYASLAPDEQRMAYSAARRGLLDLETRLNVAKHAGILPAPVLAQIAVRLGTVNRLLAGYVAYLDRQAEQAALGLSVLPQVLRVDLVNDRDVGVVGDASR